MNQSVSGLYGLKNVSLKVWEELITQRRYPTKWHPPDSHWYPRKTGAQWAVVRRSATRWLINYLVINVPLNTISLRWRRHEWLQILDLCSALRALTREKYWSWHTCCDTGPRFFWSHSIASYDSQRNAGDLFLPGSSPVNMPQKDWLLNVQHPTQAFKS
jgi:hypothetical protein